MNLKTRHWGKIILSSLGVVALILLVACFIRVAVWENNYYNEKEGSERATPQIIEGDVVDETPVTEEQVSIYTVPPDNPRYLSINKIGVSKTRVIEVGVLASGEVGTPRNIFDVGWYTELSKPGFGGKILIDGHNGGPTEYYGVFRRLSELTDGDIISIERGDGQIFNYSVTDNRALELEAANVEMRKVFSPTDKETLVLISCTGRWNEGTSTYEERQFVYAELVTE